MSKKSKKPASKLAKVKALALSALSKAKSLVVLAKDYSLKNHLMLLNSALLVAVLLKLSSLEQRLFQVYIDLAQGIGMTFFALLQIASKLFSGDPA
jgi:hypothetical protein